MGDCVKDMMNNMYLCSAKYVANLPSMPGKCTWPWRFREGHSAGGKGGLKFQPCVASLPGYSERLASEKSTTHLVHSEHVTVRKSRCESTGRCTGYEWVGNIIPTKAGV